MTASGKVNRKALLEVDLSKPERNTEYLPPEGEIEKQLTTIMEGVLNDSPIGRDDNFFDLGGDSLKAIEFLSKAHNDRLYFSLQNVFDYPTVRQLRQCMEEGDKFNVSYEGVDFSQIDKLLAKNRPGGTVPPEQDMGSILLTGSTGFLGIHILADYLEHDTGTAYCLVRGKNQAESERRLSELLNFYFGNKYTNLIGRRVQVMCGDLQKDNLGLDSQEYEMLLENVDTVINAAASVKHYGSYQYFREVNVDTVGRLITFCRNGHAKLIHSSTLSVSGNSFGDDFSGYISETEKHFYESNLYIGQPLENVYARSKFEAEKLVLEAALDGLPVHIMRMGNLTNRQSDGVFQINHQTNAAAQRIKGIVELGIVPDYLINEDMYVEFTPIDEAAQAIMLLVRYFDPERTVFHINSTKVVYLDKLMEYFTILGYPLRAVPGDEFTAALRETAKQAGMEHIFETFINDMDEQDHLNYDSNIRIRNACTEEYLHRLGFSWGEIGLEYLRKYTEYFRKIGYWEE
ncbi:thioester reductase domain-containing protein [Lachnospiraceae bacterium 45-P1]